MALVTIPAYAFPLASPMELEEARSEFTSDYNFKRITVNFPGFRWRGVYSIGLMDGTSLPGEIDFQRGFAIEAAVRQITDPGEQLRVPGVPSCRDSRGRGRNQHGCRRGHHDLRRPGRRCAARLADPVR